MQETLPYYPPTVNDVDAFKFAMGVAADLVAPSLVQETEATMAGEDFAFIARAVPSCFIFLGIRNETLGSGVSVSAGGCGVDEVPHSLSWIEYHAHCCMPGDAPQSMGSTRPASRWTRASSSWEWRCTLRWRRST